jgi:acyl-CoA thioesterase FadM
MSSIPLHVRPSDCDSYGHVNNAIYVSYFEQALAGFVTARGYADDWGRDGEHYWEPELLTLEFRRPAALGEPLEGHLWLVSDHPIQPIWGFEIRAGSSNPAADATTSVFRAKGVWNRKSRKTGMPQEIPAALLAALPQAPGVLPRGFTPPPASSGVRQYQWRHRVGICEVAPHGHAHPQALYQWVEQSLFEATADAGWPLERWLAAGVFTMQTRHDTTVHSLPAVGEEICIRSRLINVRRLGGTWLLEVERSADGGLIAADYSTGVHLGLDGRPASPPPGLTREIQFG